MGRSCKPEGGGKASQAEEDPKTPTDLRPERLEGNGEQREPCRGEKRKDAVDSECDEDTTTGHVVLHAPPDGQVVQMTRVGNDEARTRRERGPVRVDYVVVGQHRKQDEGEGNAEQGDVAAPPPLAHSSIDIPSRAACTSIPRRCDIPAAISVGSARHTVIP